MEVHHHPHVEKKTFKEYLLEGLMIFVAVTMGFIAESVREYMNKRNNAKVLSHQLVKDLISDTVTINSIVQFNINRQKKTDTLFQVLQKDKSHVNTKLLQQLVFEIYSIRVFSPTNGAFSEIEKELDNEHFPSNLPELLAGYKRKINTVKSLEDKNVSQVSEYLDPFIYEHFSPQNAYDVLRNREPVKDNLIRNLTQNDMADLSVKIEIMNHSVMVRVRWLNYLKQDAQKIIQVVSHS